MLQDTVYESDFNQIFTKALLAHVEFHKVIKLIKCDKIYEMFRKD